VIVTATSPLGAPAGALYVTDVLVAPLSVPAPLAGSIDHVTPLFEGSLSTCAFATAVPPPGTIPVSNETDMIIPGTTMVVDAVFVTSATAVAVIVTVRSSVGGVAGASYVTDVDVGLLSVPAPLVGVIDHVTPLFDASLLTVLLTDTAPPAWTVGLALVTATKMAGGGVLTGVDPYPPPHPATTSATRLKVTAGTHRTAHLELSGLDSAPFVSRSIPLLGIGHLPIADDDDKGRSSLLENYRVGLAIGTLLRVLQGMWPPNWVGYGGLYCTSRRLVNLSGINLSRLRVPARFQGNRVRREKVVVHSGSNPPGNWRLDLGSFDDPGEIGSS
jgi:hypothetical protein